MMNRTLFAFFFLTLCVALSASVASAQEEKPVQANAQPDWVTFNPSPHQSSRKGESISAIIMHFTAGGSHSGTVGWFRNPNAKVSAHYVVGRDGLVTQMVPLDQAAWHAGKSKIGDKTGVNSYSVGIEICNWGPLRQVDGKFVTYSGRKYDGPTPVQSADGRYWEPYTDAQYASLLKLCDYLVENYEITHITGHSDIAIPQGRKQDPGEAFGWEKFQKGLQKHKLQHIGPLEATK